MRTERERTLQMLRDFESRNITLIEPDGSWPVVWRRARGVQVWDTEGRRFLDLTAAFGVAAAGHANPRVVRAGQRQMETLLHAMGDVHPHELKARLARELSALTFERWAKKRGMRNAERGKVIFCNSGFEAVEAALKTALLATGRRGVIAFEGAYHGLGYGALNATHREHFRARFASQLGGFVEFAPFDCTEEALRAVIARVKPGVGAVLVEPVQGRGGIRIPSPKFLPMLRRVCREHGALLILDEIFTGFGRTGKWFACEHSGVVPDLVCLGKALAGGFPLSACVGRAEVMDAWPPSDGEAIHTSTFLGHPVGCAMALANIAELRTRGLVDRAAELGGFLELELHSRLGNIAAGIRSLGLMAGVELVNADGSPATTRAVRAMKEMLRRGFIVLPEGGDSNVISLTPPLVITRAQLRTAVRALREIMEAA
jgi:4-aminobutyrate aminotransferase-like enzyme